MSEWDKLCKEMERALKAFNIPLSSFTFGRVKAVGDKNLEKAKKWDELMGFSEANIDVAIIPENDIVRFGELEKQNKELHLIAGEKNRDLLKRIIVIEKHHEKLKAIRKNCETHLKQCKINMVCPKWHKDELCTPSCHLYPYIIILGVLG